MRKFETSCPLRVAEEPRRYLKSRRLHAAWARATGDTAVDLMSAPAVTVTMDTPIAKAARVMAERGIKRLPVVGSDGGMVGIISRADIMGVFLAPDHQIREEVISEVIERSLREDPARIHVKVTDGVVTVVNASLCNRSASDTAPITPPASSMTGAPLTPRSANARTICLKPSSGRSATTSNVM